MRTSLIGLAVATAAGLSVVTLPSAIAAHSATQTTQRPATTTTTTAAAGVVTVVPAVTSHGPAAAGARYPTNTTSLSLKPLSRTYPGPATVTFSGRLTLNDHGIATTELRLFSVKKHAVVATVSTNAAGVWHTKLTVNSSDWFFAVYSGDQNYQPALSGISKITIGNRPAVR